MCSGHHRNVDPRRATDRRLDLCRSDVCETADQIMNSFLESFNKRPCSAVASNCRISFKSIISESIVTLIFSSYKLSSSPFYPPLAHIASCIHCFVCTFTEGQLNSMALTRSSKNGLLWYAFCKQVVGRIFLKSFNTSLSSDEPVLLHYKSATSEGNSMA